MYRKKIFFSIHSGWLLCRSRSPIPVLTGLDVGQQFADRDQLATATLNLHRRRAYFGQAICLTGSVSAIHGTFLSVPVQLQPVIRLSSYAICHECNMGPASRTLYRRWYAKKRGSKNYVDTAANLNRFR